MKAFNRRRLLALAFIFAAQGPAGAAGPGKTVDGMEVFYGVVPAEVIGKRADIHDARMHGSKRLGADAQHLVVSVLDAKTGQHIDNATVVATVTPLGMAPQEKRLEPMQINQTVTYGNFFDFPPSSAPFRIAVKITRPNVATHNPPVAEFEYTPPGSR